MTDEDLLNAAGMKFDKNMHRKLQISYGGYALFPGTKQHDFSENAALVFLNRKQERNPKIIKLKLWFELEVFLRCVEAGWNVKVEGHLKLFEVNWKSSNKWKNTF